MMWCWKHLTLWRGYIRATVTTTSWHHVSLTVNLVRWRSMVSWGIRKNLFHRGSPSAIVRASAMIVMVFCKCKLLELAAIYMIVTLKKRLVITVKTCVCFYALWGLYLPWVLTGDTGVTDIDAMLDASCSCCWTWRSEAEDAVGDRSPFLITSPCPVGCDAVIWIAIDGSWFLVSLEGDWPPALLLFVAAPCSDDQTFCSIYGEFVVPVIESRNKNVHF